MLGLPGSLNFFDIQLSISNGDDFAPASKREIPAIMSMSKPRNCSHFHLADLDLTKIHDLRGFEHITLGAFPLLIVTTIFLQLFLSRNRKRHAKTRGLRRRSRIHAAGAV